jgi:subtilisin family serine protease
LKNQIANKQLPLCIILVFLFSIWIAGELNAANYCVSQNETPSEILVRFRGDSENLNRKTQKFTDLGLKFIKTNPKFNINAFEIQSKLDGEDLADLVNNIRKSPDVEWAEPNFRRYAYRSPDDPNFESQWHLENTGQTAGIPDADIGATQAWETTTGNENVVIAVLDTGVEYTHTDLCNNMWKNTAEDWNSNGTPGYNGIDDDNNGYIDDYYGADMTNGSGDPTDSYGHGTHVAGIIGAVGNNDTGGCGVAWNIKLMAVRFLNPDGTLMDELEGISYILNQKRRGVPIVAVNASFGGYEYSQFEKEAFQDLGDAGIMVAASAGNEGGESGGYSFNYPSNYMLDNIISVTASDDTDQLSGFSNYGFHYVHIAAPGENIFSTFLDDSFSMLSGTSMAAPMVSGTIGLLYSTGNRTVPETRERILRGVDFSDDLSRIIFSGGRLNASKVLSVSLTGPYIFRINPLSGDPESEVTVSGVRFGTGHSEGSGVLIGGMDAEIIEWGPEKIVFQIPEDIGQAGNIDIYVYTNEGDSNTVHVNLSSIKYRLPMPPCSGITAYLILCNYGEETVHAQVFAGPSRAFVINSREETLVPWEVRYINIKDYGLDDEKKLLWVESERDIGVSLFGADTTRGGLYYMQGQHR